MGQKVNPIGMRFRSTARGTAAGMPTPRIMVIFSWKTSKIREFINEECKQGRYLAG